MASTDMSLTDTQIQHYRREGYVVLPSFFDGEAIGVVDAVVQKITDEALANGNTAGVMELEPEQDGEIRQPRRILEPFELDQGFRGIATDDRLLDCIESLVGPDIFVNLSKLNFKPARVGSPVEWHQDLAYYPHTNDDLVTALIYLDNATEENGCLQVLPRHHHHFFEHSLADGRFAGMITEPLDDGRYGRAVPLAAPAGSVILLHPITPHSSRPNRSDRARRTLIFGFRASDAVPIWTNLRVATMESHSKLVRGKPAKFGRFGGPAPLLPVFDDTHEFKSLYTLQDEAREKTSGGLPEGM